jgi:CDP-glycerol glycerophosphotransferase
MKVRLFKYIIYRLYFAYCKFRYAPDAMTVFFEVYKGMKYDCNPRALYEEMLSNKKYEGFRFVWAFNAANFKKYRHIKDNPRTTLVRINSRKYFMSLAKAKYWITNARISRYVFPGNEHFYVETHHGKPFKRSSGDRRQGNGARALGSIKREFKSASKKMKVLFSPAPELKQHFITSWFLNRSSAEKKLLDVGYPRNDFLFKYTEGDILKIKLKLNIPLDKKVILYMPTWRVESYNKSYGKRTHACNLNYSELAEQLGDEYLFIYRVHHLEKMNMVVTGQWIDVSNHENVNELYIISDMMIGDYSSAISDYANLGRPIILYLYDLEEYLQNTGLYVDINIFPATIVTKEKDLPEAIEKLLSSFVYDEKYQRFNELYNSLDGPNCAENVLDKIIDINIQYTKKQERRKLIKVFLNNAYAVTTGFFRARGIILKKNFRLWSKYKDKYRGERCFLVGNGPSLSSLDLDKLKNEFTFGCNLIYKSFKLTDWRPTFYFFTDHAYIKEASSGFGGNSHIQMFTTINAYRKIKNKSSNFIYTATKVLNKSGFEKGRYYVRGDMRAYYVPAIATVMTYMIETAMYMGFSEIYLLGVDCSNTLTEKSHFISEYISSNVVQSATRIAKRFVKGELMDAQGLGDVRSERSQMAYAVIKKYADRNGYKIYNATRGGCLEVFERIDFDSINITANVDALLELTEKAKEPERQSDTSEIKSYV